MDRLANALERLDGPLLDQAALAGNLRDLRRINRLLGGVGLSRRAIEALLDDARSISLLDVGAGGADIPVALLAAWRRRGIEATIVAVDSRPEVLEAAIIERPALDGIAGLALTAADGRFLPFEDGAFDVAHASLLLHHLEPEDGLTLLREMARVARLGVVVNDLARGRLAWLGAWAIGHLATRNALTRHDAPLSVRRAYTLSEARGLLAEAGLRIVHEESGFLGHRWAVAAVRT